MADRNEEEIYSIMFKSLKHPVRRRILKLLNDKPLSFMELAELVGISSSHLTYHLESLGELVCKQDETQYRLSNFGKATVCAMKGVEEAPELENRRPKKMAKKWKAVFAVLMVTVLLLSSFGVYQYVMLTQLAADQSSLEAENQLLLSWGIGTSKVADYLRNVTQIDTKQYRITLLGNTLEYRGDFDVAEEVLHYSLTSASSALDITFRFRENHLSRYQLASTAGSPLLTENPFSSILENAKAALSRYKTYSGDAYLDEMSSLLESVPAIDENQTVVTEGDLKLQITLQGGSAEFLWMYSQNGVDYSAKSLRMTFSNGVLTAMTDGYFLFTIADAELNVNQDQAVAVAQGYIKGISWVINGTKTGNFTVQDTLSVELLPHPRSDSVALVPYWYVVLRLDKVYSGGINAAAVGVWADTGEVADVQMLSR